MDNQLKVEIKGRTLKLSAYDIEKELLDKAELKLKRLYGQTHETVNDRRIKLTNRRRIAKAKVLIDSLFEGDIDVSEDVINQLTLIDKGL